MRGEGGSGERLRRRRCRRRWRRRWRERRTTSRRPLLITSNGSRVECLATRHCRRSPPPPPRAAVCSSTTRGMRRGLSVIRGRRRRTRRPMPHSFARCRKCWAASSLATPAVAPTRTSAPSCSRPSVSPTSTPRTPSRQTSSVRTRRPSPRRPTASALCTLSLGSWPRSGTNLASARPPARAATNHELSHFDVRRPLRPLRRGGERAAGLRAAVRTGRRGAGAVRRGRRAVLYADRLWRRGSKTAAECAAAGGAWRAKATTEAECGAYGYECFATDDAHYVGPHGPMANRTARVPDPSFSPQQCSNAERTAGTCRPSMVDVPLCPSCLPHWSRRRALAARPYAWSPGVYQRNRWMADGLQWVSRGAAKAVSKRIQSRGASPSEIASLRAKVERFVTKVVTRTHRSRRHHAARFPQVHRTMDGTRARFSLIHAHALSHPAPPLAFTPTARFSQTWLPRAALVATIACDCAATLRGTIAGRRLPPTATATRRCGRRRVRSSKRCGRWRGGRRRRRRWAWRGHRSRRRR